MFITFVHLLKFVPLSVLIMYKGNGNREPATWILQYVM